MENSPQDSSFVSLLSDVFSAPGDAAAGIRDGSGSTTNWLIPFLLTCVIVATFSYLFATNPTFHQQIADAQDQQLQQNVQAGKMTQDQADQARAGFERLSPGFFIAIGTVAGSVFIALFFFGGAMFLWLTGKFALKAPQPYGKYLELYGSSALIGVLGAIVTIFMVIGLNTMYASPSAALAVLNDFSATNKAHKFLAALNVFSLWQATYIGIGLAKFSGKSTTTGVGVALGLFAVWTVVAVMLNIAR